MQRGRRTPDQRSLLTDTETDSEATLNVALTAKDLETLLKLQDAGLISLDGLALSGTSPKLVEWTYEEFERHMAVEQKLRAAKKDGRDSTVTKRSRSVRFLETHPEAPVDLRPPDEESWLEHVRYRMMEEGATGSTLNNYRKAMKSLLKYLGEPVWPSLDKRFDEAAPHWTLPPEDVVPRFWLEPLHTNAYVAATFAHIFHFGFHVGVRPPSEICALDLDDVDFSARRITVTEIKKGGAKRDIEDVEPFVITAKNCKSLRNYADHVRPQVDTGESSAFFLNTEGRRFNPDRLRQDLSKAGKRVWPKFVPYTMRRHFATHFLMANDFNVYVTADRLGDTVATVEKHYLDKALARAGMRGKYRMKRFRGSRK